MRLGILREQYRQSQRFLSGMRDMGTDPSVMARTLVDNAKSSEGVEPLLTDQRLKDQMHASAAVSRRLAARVLGLLGKNRNIFRIVQ